MVRRYVLNGEGDGSHSISGIDYASELNEQQLAAVMAPPGPALVIAGAGAGKTRTLTYRVAWLIDHGIDPGQILLLTFTNKASREMLERVRELVPVDLSALWGGTFHSIANRLLRRHADKIGFTRSFSIMDSDDRKSMLKAVIKSLDLGDKDKRFPKAEVIASIFSLADNTGEGIKHIVECDYPYHSPYLEAILNIREEYDRRKREANSMDFDDLLLHAVELLEKDSFIRDLYRNKFRHILVDEFQDTNALQDRMIDLLADGDGNMMVVGDDAQSIYSWRGADMRHILNFTIKHPTARTYKIETNYRSVPEILNLSNAAIAANENRIEKELRSVRPASSMPPALVALNDTRMEAMFVVQRIGELMESGVEASEIAVLYRAHFHSMDVQMELTRRHVPFLITSGLRFFEQAHVKDVLSFLRFAVNGRDELSFKRMVSLLPGIGPASCNRLWKQWVAHLEEPVTDGDYERISGILVGFTVPSKARKAWDQLGLTLDELTPEGLVVKPSSMIFSVVEAMYDEYMQASFDNYDQRCQDLNQLSSFADRFESTDEFLAQMSLLGNTDQAADEAGRSGSVTLSTIHQAKGLEWRVVFLIGLCDGMFPHQRSLEEGNLNALEEERRLFYVGITRAKDQLYLTYPRWNSKVYGGAYSQMPSRFLDEWPSNLVEEWQIE